MGDKIIGFDLDGVLLSNTYFKRKKLMELYGMQCEEWMLNSNVIDDYVTDVDVRHHVGRLAGTSQNDRFVDGSTITYLEKIKALGWTMVIISRRGKSPEGHMMAQKSIECLGIADYFENVYFCASEKDKIATIKKLGVNIFVDDRIEVVTEISNQIEQAVLFDPFKLVKRNILKCDSSILVINDFFTIYQEVLKYEQHLV